MAPCARACRRHRRRDVVAEPTIPTPAARSAGRRGRIALVAAVLALALAGAGWGVYSAAFDSPETVRSDFRDVTAAIPLPPGATWEEPIPDEEGLYGQQAGLMIALGQATCAWLGYWEDGDAGQKAEALAGFRRVRALMPLHPEGAPEEAGGYDAGSLRYFDELIAEAARGEAATVRQYLGPNCS
jgi:hypothetical protein